MCALLDAYFVENDEVKEHLRALVIDEEIKLLDFTVRLTKYGYEIENDEYHIGFLSFEDCYIKINS